MQDHGDLSRYETVRIHKTVSAYASGIGELNFFPQSSLMPHVWYYDFCIACISVA